MNENEIAILISGSLQGDRESFESLVNYYQKPVFNIAYRMLNSYEDARDVTQNVFLKVYQNFGEFDSRRKFFSWLYRIALNESINLRKSRRVHLAISDGITDRRTSPDDLLQSTEMSRAIQSALMSMDPDQRAVIVLRLFHQCSYQDISEILNVPEKTVKSRLFTARNHLRQLLFQKGIL